MQSTLSSLKFTIYQVTNLVNGKIYIGKHQTRNLDDNYMGSGKMISRAIKKYGWNNFKKEILFVFETEQEMNSKEAELVTEEFCSREDTYNLCPGGHGGWGYINDSNIVKFFGTHSEEAKRKISQTSKGRVSVWKGNSEYMKLLSSKGGRNNKGKPKSKEHKQKIREALLRRNSAGMA